MKNDISTILKVKDQDVRVVRIDGREYISLTDLARYADSDEPRFPIINWMKNKDVVLYLGLWESVNNDNFNRVEFDTFKNEAGANKFIMSPQKWIKGTNAIGMISKSGRYDSGTFAVSDIAFEFASWLSPEFKLYLIQEFQRLKKNESYQNKIDWQANRILSKANYLIHTDAIKNYIIPELSDKQIHYVYAEEADVLNVAIFGMTAKEWRDNNPDLADKGNIRDYTDLLHLIILSNLENTNAELIKMGLSQSERIVKLNQSARNQIELFKNNKNILEIEKLSKDRATIEGR